MTRLPVGIKFKVISEGHGQISRSVFEKMAIVGPLLFHKHCMFPQEFYTCVHLDETFRGCVGYCDEWRVVEIFCGPSLKNRSIRREEVIITRLRIGHSHLTHSWLLAKEDAPECIQCNEYLTMKHILLDCIDFQPNRDKHYSADNMYNLFDTVRIDSIIAFIKEIGLYNKL